MQEIVQIKKFYEIKDKRGSLVSLESNQNIPFDIKRVYYIYGTQNIARGFHAHKALQQVAVCVAGSCTIMLDDGQQKQHVRLDKPSQGVFIDKMIWHEMYDFSEDCVFMVLASDHYDEEDYIRSYEEFLAQ